MKQKRLSVSRDFDASMLPKTRKAVFSDVIKIHFRHLLLLGMILFLFFVPLIIVTLTKDLRMGELLSDFNISSEERKQELLGMSLSLKSTFLILQIPCFLIISVALSGISRVIRQYSWEENVSLSHDFAVGVKQNIGQCFALGTVFSICYTVASYTFSLSTMQTNTLLGILFLLPLAIFVLAVIPLTVYTMMCICIYSNTWVQNFRIAVALYFGNILHTIFRTVILLIPFIPCFIPNIPAHQIGLVLSSLFIPLILLGWFLSSYDMADRLVNNTGFPDLVGKGIR